MGSSDWPTVELGEFVEIANDMAKIRKAMQCYCCEEIPAPKDVMTCRKGHLVCMSCYDLLPEGKKCPGEMQQPLNPDTTDTKPQSCIHKLRARENELYTFMYNNSAFKCQYSEYGCEATPNGVNVEIHESMCRYRPTLVCPFSECAAGLSQISYVQHLSTVHEILTFDTSSQRVQVPFDRQNKGIRLDKTKRYRWISALFKCFDLQFMLVVEEEGRHFRMCVMLISPSTDFQDRRFRWTMSFVPIPKARGSLSWPGDVLPLSDDFEDVLSSGEFVLVQKPTMKKNFIFRIDGQEFWNVDVVIREIQNKEMKEKTDADAEAETDGSSAAELNSAHM